MNTNRWRADFLLADSLDDRLSPVRRTASFEVYPQPDPNLRDGATQVYGKGWWRRLAAAQVRALFAIVVVLFVLGFD